MGQCGPQGNVARGDQGQGLQDGDIARTPLAWYLVGYPEHPRDPAVRVTYRDPGPGDHARRTGQVTVTHRPVQPGVTDDQFVPAADDIGAHQSFKPALLAVG